MCTSGKTNSETGDNTHREAGRLSSQTLTHQGGREALCAEVITPREAGRLSAQRFTPGYIGRYTPGYIGRYTPRGTQGGIHPGVHRETYTAVYTGRHIQQCT